MKLHNDKSDSSSSDQRHCNRLQWTAQRTAQSQTEGASVFDPLDPRMAASIASHGAGPSFRASKLCSLLTTTTVEQQSKHTVLTCCRLAILVVDPTCLFSSIPCSRSSRRKGDGLRWHVDQPMMACATPRSKDLTHRREGGYTQIYRYCSSSISIHPRTHTHAYTHNGCAGARVGWGEWEESGRRV